MLNASLLPVNAATGLDTNDLGQALLVDLEYDFRDSRLLLFPSRCSSFCHQLRGGLPSE
jgi:hypothetical protein